MVSVLALYSDDPSFNPAEVYKFSVKLILKRTKNNKKRPGLGQFQNMVSFLQNERTISSSFAETFN